MKARLTVLTGATVLSMSASLTVLPPAAQAAQAPVQRAARAASPTVAWAYVSSKQQKKSFYKKKAAIPVGRSGGAVHRAYYKLDLSDAVSEDIVSSVRLRIPVSTPNPCRKGGAPAVKVQQIRSLAAKPTWKKQPKVTKTLATVKPKCAGKTLDLNLTKVAAGVLNGGGDSLSIRIVSANEKKAKNFLKLSYSAKLTVRAYSNGDTDGGAFGDPAANRPGGVTGPGFSGGACVVGAGRPKLADPNVVFTGSVADPDGGFIGLRVQWEPLLVGAAKAADSPIQFSDPNEARAFRVAPPAASFEDGKVYRWRLQGFDDFGGGEWTNWCEFSIDLADPPEKPVAEPAA